ncbi:MAG: hypothetical protein EA369_05760 [Bradymonadales bacterium]|nr:MAG: hypothetical protein EA369_05760 [Bradymonadales bacterium]
MLALALLCVSFSLQAWDQRISDQNPGLWRDARNFAERLPGLEFFNDEERASFRGKVYRAQDLETLHEFVMRSNSQIELDLDVSNELLEDLREAVRQISPRAELQIKAGVLHLSSEDPSLIREVRGWGLPIRSELRPSIQPKAPSRQVRLELAFIEIRKSRLQDLGLRFGSPIDFLTSLHLRTASALQIEGINPIGSFLDLALAEGDATIHHKQSLVSREGLPAQFEAGGEYAVRLSGRQRSSIERIRYGLNLGFEVRFVGEDQIDLKVEASIREPDLAGGIDGLPLIQHKRLTTNSRIRLRETSAIAGLYQLSKSGFRQAVPGIDRVPLLGNLLQSRSYRRQESEAYIFVTATEPEGPWRIEKEREDLN